tara:strand:- start:826 stop:1041 length:216 start_codon:yes stop_codon:yes gene_type:complete
MWLPIILVCSAPYVESCDMITGLELLETKEECFAEVNVKANIILKSPTVYLAKPACQILPEKVKKEKGTDI